MNAISNVDAVASIGVKPRPISNANFALFVPLFCVAILGIFTVTAPTSFLVESYGTRSILPNPVIVLGKTLTRAVTLALLTGLMPLIWHRPTRAAVIWLAAPWFAFGVWGVLSTVWSPNLRISLGQSAGFCCLLYVSLAIGILCRGTPDISRVLSWLSGLLAFISGALIFLHFAMPEVRALTKWALGIFHSTCACASASLAVTILLAARMIWDFPWARRYWLPGVLLHGTVLAIGLSRTSIGIALLLAGLIGVLYGNRLLMIVGCLVVPLAGILYLILDPNLYLLTSSAATTETFLSQGQSRADMATLTGRTEMWEVMWKSFLDSPWLGHGYFMTSSTGEIYVWHEWGNWTAHSFVLQLLVTTGIIGATFFAAGLITTGYALLRRLGAGPEARKAVQFCFLIALWHALFGLMDSSILGAISPEGCVFACVLGIAFSVAAVPADEFESTFAAMPDDAVTSPGQVARGEVPLSAANS